MINRVNGACLSARVPMTLNGCKTITATPCSDWTRRFSWNNWSTLLIGQLDGLKSPSIQLLCFPLKVPVWSLPARRSCHLVWESPGSKSHALSRECWCWSSPRFPSYGRIICTWFNAAKFLLYITAKAHCHKCSVSFFIRTFLCHKLFSIAIHLPKFLVRSCHVIRQKMLYSLVHQSLCIPPSRFSTYREFKMHVRNSIPGQCSSKW